MNEKSSCSPCPFGTQNGNVGQIECNACANSEICLIGSTSPMFSNYHNDYISNYDITKANYLQVDNYPEFIDQNSKNEIFITYSRTYHCICTNNFGDNNLCDLIKS